ncbi:GMC family oxidoreductase N-terminal domain-containing protein [Kaistia geumhonensis]|uniref:Choline dehydrogenase n=1 Tax=Kaistia geumhonensis TaxID=410839 RepID=A0ABU0MAQ0_9HYPH|nr:GMC family oxidoreductase N-terminal domain-containing protein [Kaistia geumhonensis]MCX5480980.1 GMC family oxidoreductase N-terminal domain-containing protein [Kaistia geumhonensis]MDQ0518037.1 choline dehydrogenase [Kaistia geumhonensis]
MTASTPPALLPSYDYIVVGGGTAGSAVARRLAERSSATVLVIEAGPDDEGFDGIADPARWVAFCNGSLDWGYEYAATSLVNGRTMALPRGRVLGGSSSTGALHWYRGHAADYDAWAAAGATGWSFDACLPFFRRIEDWEDGETSLRGADGPMRIERSRDPHPLAWAMIEGAAELGIPIIDDPNGASNEGAALANLTQSGGRRWSAATGYLHAGRPLANLTVLTRSLALRLTFAHGRCTGVHHLVGDRVTETAARVEVILSLGAIDTPRLLLLSGIGNSAALGRLGIDTVADLHGVGANLQDHPMIRAVNFRARAPLGPIRDNGGGSVINWRSRPGLARPDLTAICFQRASAVPELAADYDLTGDVFAIAPGLMESRSKGHLRLLESGPGGRMEIQPNFLSHPDDLEALVTAVDFAMDLVETSAFAKLFASYLAPGRRLDRAETVDFIRTTCTTYFHTCGTCRMGTDDEAVVDPELRVRGIEGLRIADASVIPVIPSCGTMAPTLMIAERAADFITGPH